jgi:hypothetical protein
VKYLLLAHLILKIISEHIQRRTLSIVCSVQNLLLGHLIFKIISEYIQKNKLSIVYSVQNLLHSQHKKCSTITEEIKCLGNVRWQS